MGILRGIHTALESRLGMQPGVSWACQESVGGVGVVQCRGAVHLLVVEHDTASRVERHQLQQIVLHRLREVCER